MNASTGIAVPLLAAVIGVFRAQGFDAATVRAKEIRDDVSYGGVRMRVRLVARLNGARIGLQVDIGFGDAVTPGPESITYPLLLDDLPAPTLRPYPMVTVIAEKFHALCVLGMANSRMKDYFDLWFLLRDASDIAGLRAAIDATFVRRRTTRPNSVPIGVSDSFAGDHDKQIQWRAFITRNRLSAPSLASTIAYKWAIAAVGNHNVKGESGSRSNSKRSYQPRACSSLASTITPIIPISTESRRQRCSASASNKPPSPCR